MTAHDTAVPRFRKLGLPLVALIAMLATFIVTASPAAAVPVCDDTDPEFPVVQVLETNPPDVTLRMSGGDLLMNGAVCGEDVTAVTIIDFAGAGNVNRQDTITIDARTPFVRGMTPVFVNFLLTPDSVTGEQDIARIVTSDSREDVILTGATIVIENAAGDSHFLGRVLTPGDTPAHLDFRLNGGNDSFRMVSESGVWYPGNITVRGGAGNDDMTGGPGRQEFRGGTGADDLRGRSGNDVLKGNGGADELRGGSGNDVVRGGTGTDEVLGNGGDDRLFGNGGDDEIRGGGGDDDINGGKGNDTMFGNRGNDTFDASDRRVDVVSGGAGNDTCDCDARDRVRASVENT